MRALSGIRVASENGKRVIVRYSPRYTRRLGHYTPGSRQKRQIRDRQGIGYCANCGSVFCYNSGECEAQPSYEGLQLGMLVWVRCDRGCAESNCCGLNGKVGRFVGVNEHNENGDFYGVKFLGDSTIVYFWRHELIAAVRSVSEVHA